PCVRHTTVSHVPRQHTRENSGPQQRRWRLQPPEELLGPPEVPWSDNRRKMNRSLKTFGWTALLWLASLAAGVVALLLAEFGAPQWVFILLLVWLLTFGLPTLAAVLILAASWPGPSFGAYVLSAASLAFLFQLGAVWGVRRAV